MKIIIDMNLSPTWVSYLEKHGIEAKHWSQVGKANNPDSVILAWAKQHQCIVFTNDLDFGAILALSNGKTPSVFQLRTQDLLPHSIGKIVIENLERFQLELSQGALISLELDRAKVRILPII